jgi:TRAP-type C4-dicarboxylate transport system permease small subunit
VLGWPLGIVYSVFLAFAVMVILRCLAEIVRPARRNPPSAK